MRVQFQLVQRLGQNTAATGCHLDMGTIQKRLCIQTVNQRRVILACHANKVIFNQVLADEIPAEYRHTYQLPDRSRRPQVHPTVPPTC